MKKSRSEPQLVPKNKTRLEGFEEKILHLYACGMITRDIQSVEGDVPCRRFSHRKIVEKQMGSSDFHL